MSEPSKEHSRILCTKFNQQNSCLAIGTQDGWRIFECKPFRKLFERREDGGVSHLEMLWETAVVVIVGAGFDTHFSPRHLQVVDKTKRAPIYKLDFDSSVITVKANRERLVVVLEEEIHIFDFRRMSFVAKLRTPSNPHGVVALSKNVNKCYMAFPHDVPGRILVYDCLNAQQTAIISAHTQQVRFLEFSDDGTKLASCSVSGTVIYIWSIPSGEKLHELRRGTQTREITSISFSPDKNASLIAVASTSPTVHIFDLTPPDDKEDVVSVATNTLWNYAKMLPGGVGRYLQPIRSFAQVRIPSQDEQQRCVTQCGFSGEASLVICNTNGYFCRYEVIAPKDGVGPSSPAAFSGYLCVTDPTCNGTLRLIWEANLIEKPSDVLSVQRDDRRGSGSDRRGRRSDGAEPSDDRERERQMLEQKHDEPPAGQQSQSSAAPGGGGGGHSSSALHASSSSCSSSHAASAGGLHSHVRQVERKPNSGQGRLEASRSRPNSPTSSTLSSSSSPPVAPNSSNSLAEVPPQPPVTSGISAGIASASGATVGLSYAEAMSSSRNLRESTPPPVGFSAAASTSGGGGVASGGGGAVFSSGDANSGGGVAFTGGDAGASHPVMDDYLGDQSFSSFARPLPSTSSTEPESSSNVHGDPQISRVEPPPDLSDFQFNDYSTTPPPLEDADEDEEEDDGAIY